MQFRLVYSSRLLFILISVCCSVHSSNLKSFIEFGLGYIGDVEGITVKLLDLADLWMLTGFLRNIHNTFDYAVRLHSSNSRKRPWALYFDADITAPEAPDAADDGDYDMYGGSKNADNGGRRRRRWELDKETSVWNWRNEDKSWGLDSQAVSRTEDAIILLPEP